MPTFATIKEHFEAVLSCLCLKLIFNVSLIVFLFINHSNSPAKMTVQGQMAIAFDALSILCLIVFSRQIAVKENIDIRSFIGIC